MNTICFIDVKTSSWETIKPEGDLLPKPHEHVGVSYDQRESRLLIFGGLNDVYSLNVSKIVGPSYAVTSIEPAASQLSGGKSVTIRGAGFKDQNIKVFFTAGDSPFTQVTPD